MFRLIRRVVRGIRWRIALPYTFLLIVTMAGFGVYVSRLIRQVQADSGQFQRNILVFSLLLAGAAVLLGIWIADRVTRPVRQLSQTVSDMAEGDLSKRLYPRTQDEIGQLTEAIDSMARQLNFQITELQAEESKLSAVLEQMSDGVVMVDQAGEVALHYLSELV